MNGVKSGGNLVVSLCVVYVFSFSCDIFHLACVYL